jgi:hypothetical protein
MVLGCNLHVMSLLLITCSPTLSKGCNFSRILKLLALNFLRPCNDETRIVNTQWRNATRRCEGLANVNVNGMMQVCSIHQKSDLSGLHAGGRESTLVYLL